MDSRSAIGTLFAAIALAVVHLGVTDIWAATGQPSSSSTNDPVACNAGISSVRTYCGLKSVYVAALAIGTPVEFRELLQPQFVGINGSTTRQIVEATRTLGLDARASSQLTSLCLRESSCPVILHTKASFDDPTFDHWVCFLGMQNDEALLIDGDHGVALTSLKDLSALWDGTGVFVSKTSGSIWPLQLAATLLWTTYALCAALIAMATNVLLLAASRQRFTRRFIVASRVAPLSEALALGGVAVAAGMCFPLLFGPGYLDCTAAVEGLQELHRTSFLSTVSLGELDSELKQMGHERPVLVDARTAAEFRDGHIADALNIPVTSSATECQTVLGHLPKGHPIIVYCKIPACPYSDRVAGLLLHAGYSNVRLFRAGYVAWATRESGKLKDRVVRDTRSGA